MGRGGGGRGYADKGGQTAAHRTKSGECSGKFLRDTAHEMPAAQAMHTECGRDGGSAGDARLR